MQILIVSDAWLPQINGVVRTLQTLGQHLEGLGYEIGFLTPELFPTVPCPSYPEIRLALSRPGAIPRMIDAAQPGAIHIATEGPLGFLARRYCLKRGFPFTTSFHTRFPEYINARWSVPLRWTYGFLRWFHGAAERVMVATQSIETELYARGFRNLHRWTRGVDTGLFYPRRKDFLPWPRPISLYVGRVAVEKNIEAFLRLSLPGTKVIVGDGPLLPELRARYPEARFVGSKTGEDLAAHYAASDVFVFPSRTDTFGLVMIEALASGVPVAAYPVAGPLDVLGDSGAGVMDEDLGRAVRGALGISPEVCLAHAQTFSWHHSVNQFLGALALRR